MATEQDTSDDIDWRSDASSAEMSRRDRLKEFYQQSIYEPAVVAWSDTRTRYGLG